MRTTYSWNMSRDVTLKALKLTSDKKIDLALRKGDKQKKGLIQIIVCQCLSINDEQSHLDAALLANQILQLIVHLRCSKNDNSFYRKKTLSRWLQYIYPSKKHTPKFLSLQRNHPSSVIAGVFFHYSSRLFNFICHRQP